MMGVYHRYNKQTRTHSQCTVTCVYITLTCLQVSVRLMELFSHWQQGALQQIKNTINTLAKTAGQRAKVTSAPAESSDDDGDDETQVCLCRAQQVLMGCQVVTDHAMRDSYW